MVQGTLAVHVDNVDGAAQPAAAATHCLAGRVVGTNLHVLRAHCIGYYSPSSWPKNARPWSEPMSNPT